MVGERYDFCQKIGNGECSHHGYDINFELRFHGYFKQIVVREIDENVSDN